MIDKLKDINELKAILIGAKELGKKIVFANGVFDILHVGHIRYLKEARSLGDMLIVAVNSDTSTNVIKGAGRPYTPESERIEILSELNCIDYLILFDDKEVRRLLRELKPDIQVKGTDYTAETVPERDTVLAYGGQVMIAGDEKRHSSTEIIDKLSTP